MPEGLKDALVFLGFIFLLFNVGEIIARWLA